MWIFFSRKNRIMQVPSVNEIPNERFCQIVVAVLKKRILIKYPWYYCCMKLKIVRSEIILPYCTFGPTCRLCCFAWTPHLPLNLNSPTTVRNRFWMSIFSIQFAFHEIFHCHLFSHTCYYLVFFLISRENANAWMQEFCFRKYFILFLASYLQALVIF